MDLSESPTIASFAPTPEKYGKKGKCCDNTTNNGPNRRCAVLDH